MEHLLKNGQKKASLGIKNNKIIKIGKIHKKNVLKL